MNYTLELTKEICSCDANADLGPLIANSSGFPQFIFPVAGQSSGSGSYTLPANQYMHCLASPTTLVAWFVGYGTSSDLELNLTITWSGTTWTYNSSNPLQQSNYLYSPFTTTSNCSPPLISRPNGGYGTPDAASYGPVTFAWTTINGPFAIDKLDIIFFPSLYLPL